VVANRFFAGDALPAAGLNLPPWGLGVIAYGTRPSSNGNVAAFTPSGSTATGVLRVDNIEFISGRRYMIQSSDLRVDLGTATDRARFEVRLSTSGAATTSTAIWARSESSSADLNNMAQIERVYTPSSSTTTGSLLLSVSRPSGTGTISVLAGTDDETLWIAVTDLGLAVADTGVVLV
jgi:hypothetical protein